MSLNQKFILTTDSLTATLLSKSGFQKIQEINGKYLFMNNKKLVFDQNLDKAKIHYTSILCV